VSVGDIGSRSSFILGEIPASPSGDLSKFILGQFAVFLSIQLMRLLGGVDCGCHSCSSVDEEMAVPLLKNGDVARAAAPYVPNVTVFSTRIGYVGFHHNR
jgi:hypothetical protein